MSPLMNLAFAALLVAVLGLPWGSARADSLRCAGGIAAEGDSRLSLVYKCGQPQLADSFCAPVYQGRWVTPVPEPFASAMLPCLLTEQWLYERGPGNLVATVTLRDGRIRSIVYGRVPQ